MPELIDRQAALEIAMCYCPDDDGCCSKAGHDIREMLDEIEALPTITPEVRHGRWRIIDNDWNCWRCTCCGEEWVLNDGNPSDNGMMFCPHCGARMDASCLDDESEAGA